MSEEPEEPGQTWSPPEPAPAAEHSEPDPSVAPDQPPATPEPAPAPTFEPAPATGDGLGTAGRPEIAVGAAFAGGFLFALILKRLAR